MRLVIASNNAHKIGEIRAILGDSFDPVVSMREAGLELDVVEDADTFAGNAMKKAVAAAELLPGDAVLADDSGLMVDALGGAPGVRSARYATDGHDDAANRAKLVSALQNTADGERQAHFVTAAVLIMPGRPPIEADGRVDGFIGREERGTGGFGYDSLFYYPPAGKTFAELTAEEKNGVSHRRNAIAAVKALLGGATA